MRIVTGAVPVFVIDTRDTNVVPTRTLPKTTVDGAESVRVAAVPLTTTSLSPATEDRIRISD